MNGMNLLWQRVIILTLLTCRFHLDFEENPEFPLYVRQRYQNLVSNMINTLTLIYFKLAELISTIAPSTDGMLNQFGMQMLELSNATDPGAIIGLVFETLMMLVVIIVIFPITLAYRLFMGLIGQPVPVPWF